MITQRNQVGWFEIYVDDLSRAQAFYEKVFEVKLQALDNCGWHRVRKDRGDYAFAL